MTNKTYDILKQIALWAVPLSVFVASMGKVWGLPYAEQISATLAAIDVLIGAVVSVSAQRYHAAEDLDESEEDEDGTDDNC